MTDYYKERLLRAYRLHTACGYDYKQAAEHFGYGKAVNDHIRAMWGRFAKINASDQDVQDYLIGNYLRSVKAVEYHLRFVGERNRQISARRLAEELRVYDVERLKCMLYGMAYVCPDLVSYSDTNGLDSLNIR